MNGKQEITTIEFLSNELFIECFEYLNSIDILYGFNQLNHRFTKLIENIPLYLNFQNIPQTKFNKFYTQILSNEKLQKQIYSLHLSNENICWQIQPFLSHISLNQCIHLQSLRLIEVQQQNMKLIQLILPLLSQLSSFHLTIDKDITDDIITSLPITQMKTLTIPKFFVNPIFLNKLSSIRNLTMISCNFKELISLLKHSSHLQYLKTKLTKEKFGSTYKTSSTNLASQLKQLNIVSYYGEINELEILFKQTPNLTKLIIFMDYSDEQLRAKPWENMINTYLSHLNIFTFEFFCYCSTHWLIKIWFEEFQDKFWLEEHHWHTRYSISKRSSTIYTIPYISNRFVMDPEIETYSSKLINHKNDFHNVTHLTIDPNALIDNCQYHFSNVTSINLWYLDDHDDKLFEIKHIQCLKQIINLSNITDLKIHHIHRIITSSVLFQILEETQNISSLSIDQDYLFNLFNDNKLCKYLNKFIKKLDICNDKNKSFNNYDQLNQFCDIFSNINQLTCIIHDQSFLLLIIKRLPYLSLINLPILYDYNCYSVMPKKLYQFNLFQLENELKKLGEIIIVNSSEIIKIYLFR